MFDVQDEENIYYHYCSLDTFLKIIDTSKLRLCNPYKMNDSKELCWFFDLLPNIIEEYISKFDNEEIKNRYRYFYQDSISKVYKLDFLGKEAPHITCFSECGDILSQWRAYADNGKGVAIGFDVNEFLDKSNITMVFKTVCYDLAEQRELLLQILETNGLSDPDKVEFHRMKHVYTAAIILIDEILLESVHHKNPAFAEEKEGRLIFFPNDVDYLNNKGKSKIEITGPFFRSNGEEIISYYELDFSKVKNEIIKSIYIGPKSKVTEFDIKLLLKANGYHNHQIINILKSTASYK